MEIQLQELIDKIKKDGIEAASGEAARIKADAEAEAARIVAAAQKEAADIVSRGRADAERAEKAGRAALEQASRNLVLAFKGEIQALLDKIIARATASAYGEDTLRAVLPELLRAWPASGSDSVDLLLSQGNLENLRSWAEGALAAELQKGIELKSDRNLGGGFRISAKDGSAYYDFSAESVAGLLSAYVNPHVAEILNNSAKGM
jgi:V/A-type H+-transporting ATPase subunit E